MKLVMMFLLLLPLTAQAIVPLNQTEKNIVAAAHRSVDDALELLVTAVNINSGTLNFSGVKRVGDLFSAQLESLGFVVRWEDGKSYDRAGQLVASRGSKGPRILLIGHLDTVFEPDSPFQLFEMIDKQHVRGPGVVDMKGGDVVMVHALKALQEAGALDAIQVKVVMMGDEESRGLPHSLSNKALIDAGIWADYAIGFEDGDGDPTTAVVSRRGATAWRLQVSGKSAHSSQIFQDQIGYGAIFEAARILDQFRVQLSGVENLTFNPGMIIGGTDIEPDFSAFRGSAFGKNNVIAKSVIVSGGIRALSPEQLQMAQSEMQEIVENNLSHTQAELKFFPGYPPMAPSDGNNQLLEIYSAVSQDLGYGPVSCGPATRGSCRHLVRC
jgi:glutamate carboxypeptidase